MRCRQNGQRGDPIRMPAGRAPSLVAAPVMTNDVGLGKPGGVEQGDHVRGCSRGSIVPSPGGSSRTCIAALCRNKRAQPLSVQLSGNGVESRWLLRKSMEQDDRRSISRPGVDNLEAQPRA